MHMQTHSPFGSPSASPAMRGQAGGAMRGAMSVQPAAAAAASPSPSPSAAAPAALGPRTVRAWAARSQGAPLELTSVSLPPLSDDSVEVRILACGLCASDCDALGPMGALYRHPLVVGHEGVGVVTEVGRMVRHLRAGQRVGIGVYRGACAACLYCTAGQNNLCALKELMFMNGSHGAFAESVRIRADFAIPIPEAIATEHAGPLLCAGVAVFAPFRRHAIQPGARVGVLGIGGLGHLALQVASKMGCEVVALSTSGDKAAAARELGAHRFVNLMREEEIKPVHGTIDYLFVTASGDSLEYRSLLGLLATNGKLIVLGVSFKEQVISPAQLLLGQKSIVGSTGGSTGLALDLLRFCAVHGIRPVVETFPFARCNEAVQRVLSNTVRFRAVLLHPAANGDAEANTTMQQPQQPQQHQAGPRSPQQHPQHPHAHSPQQHRPPMQSHSFQQHLSDFQQQ